MKAIVIAQHGAPEVLRLSDVPVPEPRADEALVQNRVIGVNFVDTQHRAGLYYPIALPLIPGTEASGVVAAVGAKVTDFHVGDRVAYAGYMGGNYAEYTAVPQDRLVPVPDTLSFEQAAACLLQGLTAYVLTHQVYAVQPSDHVLIHAAAGGVGSLLVQMAKQLGAVVIGATSSAEKAAIVSQLGADHVIVSTHTNVADATLRLTGEQGVHVVYDGVGGPLFEQNLSVLRTRGHLVLFGLSSGQPMPLDVSRLSGITGTNNRGSLSVTFASANDYLTEVDQLRASAGAVFDAVVRGQLQLRITGVFPLEHAAQAHRLLESRATTGKLLLQVV